MKKRILCLLLVLMTVVSIMPSFLMRAEATAAPVKTNLELVERLVDIATNYKTLYVMGCFGAPMTDSNKNRYSNNHSYNKQPQRTAMIKAASADTFGFDCVCLIKGVLWGWDGKLNSTYGGTVYASNGVPDLDADRMFAQCSGQSTDFSKIEIGEAVWLKGHIGVYIGNGLAVECTPSWDNCVQITAVRNIGKKDGYADRQWTKHGKLPYIEYVDPVIKTSYPSSGTIKVTAKNGTYIKSLPCSEKSNADSKNVETGSKGTTYTVIGLVENVYGNFWYKVKTQTGKEGYLYSGDATYEKHDFGKVTISGVSAPSSIVEGNAFTIKGSITSSKLPLFTVGAFVYNDTKIYLESQEHYIDKSTYQLAGSYVDNNLLFNKLGVGTYTYSVSAVVHSYSADGNKLKPPSAKDFVLYVGTFSVASKPTSCQHSYNSNYQTDSGAHWRTCTKCGAIDKKEAHTYDHACDGTCNVCGYVRSVEHDYRLEYDAQYHYKICNICGVGVELEEHQCSLIPPKPDGTEDEYHWYGCSVCSYATNEYHDYDSYVITKEPTCKETGVMTYKCSACGWTKDRRLDKLTTHTYDNDCDPSCNVCGAERDAGHNFEWVAGEDGHYLQCTICEGFQATEDHEYDDPCDVSCNICGAERNVNHDFGWVRKNEGHHQQCVICGRSTDIEVHAWHLITPNDETLLVDHHWYGCDICLFAKKEEHAYNSGIVTKQPTCNETGVKTYTCVICQRTKTETIPKLTNHSYNAGVVTKQPTCKETGIKTYTCSVCGGTKTETIAKLTTHTYGKWTKVNDGTHKHTCSVCGKEETASHSYNAGVVTRQPTCKETGIKTYTCAVCGGTKTETIAKLTTHSYGKWTKVNDTTHKHTCTVCGKEETASHGWDNGKVTKQPTCRDTGVKTYTCTVCGGTKTETIAKLTTHTYNAGVVTKQPTCKENGIKTYTCSVCGGTKTETIAKLTTHSYNAGIVTKQPTCKETGIKTYTCTICGGTKTETIAKLTTHTYNAGVVTKQPTCKDAGVKTYTCTICGVTKTETVAKLTTHTYGNWTKVNDSTHKHTCTVCGKEETGSHSWNSGVITKQPTKEAEGVKTYTCTVCNGTKTEAVPKIPTYAVVFKNWDGTVLSTKQYAIGEKVTAPAAPTRPDDADNTYTFKGWDKAVVNCNGAATYTATYTAKSRVPSTITSSTHTVSGNTISKIGVGETVEKLLGSLNEGSFVKVYSGNKEVAKDALLGTGMEVKIMDGNTVKATYTAVVTGDTNGDGKISVTDMLAAKAHILKKSTLTGAVAQAADTSGDKAISITDFLQLKAHILGKSTVSARSASPASARRAETPAPKAPEREETNETVAVVPAKIILALPNKKMAVML